MSVKKNITLIKGVPALLMPVIEMNIVKKETMGIMVKTSVAIQNQWPQVVWSAGSGLTRV